MKCNNMCKTCAEERFLMALNAQGLAGMEWNIVLGM